MIITGSIKFKASDNEKEIEVPVASLLKITVPIPKNSVPQPPGIALKLVHDKASEG